MQHWGACVTCIEEKMLKILTCALLPCVYAWTVSDTMIGRGRWMVRNMAKCPDHEQYNVDLNIKKRMLNRTHDCFEAHLNLEYAIDETYGLYIDMCKKCDGGCKQYMVLDYDCFCCVMREYVEENFVKALTLAGLDPPDCPIPAGNHEIKNFVFDYTELKEDGPFGEFKATTYLTMGKNENREKVACVDVHLEFDRNNDNE